MPERYYLAGTSKYGFHIVADREVDREARFVPEVSIGELVAALNRDSALAETYVWGHPTTSASRGSDG